MSALIGISQELNDTLVQLGFHMHYPLIRAFSEKFNSMTTVKRVLVDLSLPKMA